MAAAVTPRVIQTLSHGNMLGALGTLQALNQDSAWEANLPLPYDAHDGQQREPCLRPLMTLPNKGPLLLQIHQGY